MIFAKLLSQNSEESLARNFQLNGAHSCLSTFPDMSKSPTQPKIICRTVAADAPERAARPYAPRALDRSQPYRGNCIAATEHTAESEISNFNLPW